MTGLRLYARDVGDGFPVVLLHEFPLTSAIWLAQRESLSSRYRLITPDLRGFGGSLFTPAAPDLSVLVDDVTALMEAKGVKRAVIGGIGIGAEVAIALAAADSDRYRGLVICGLGERPGSADHLLELAGMVRAEGQPRAVVDELLPALVGSSTRQRRGPVFGRVRAIVQAAPAEPVAWTLELLAGLAGRTREVDQVRVPALVIAGEEDQLTGRAELGAVAGAMHDAELVDIPRAGHLCCVEQPDLFSTALGEFAGAIALAGG